MKIIFASFLFLSTLFAFDFAGALKSALDKSGDNAASTKNAQAAQKYTVSGYSKQTALMMAVLADGVFKKDFGKNAFASEGFVYDGHKESKRGLVDLQFAYGHKGSLSSPMDIVIAVRGSKEDIDWATDAYFVPAKYDTAIGEKIEVHSGFLQSAKLLTEEEQNVKILGKTLKKLIEENIKGHRSDRFYVTGHSLGGAVVTLYSTMLIDRGMPKNKLVVYTFGAPPVSMEEGATKDQMSSLGLDGKFQALGSVALGAIGGNSGQSSGGENYYIDRYSDKIDIYRVYDSNDLVPKLLPPAQHLGRAVMYKSTLSSSDLGNVNKLWKIHFMSNYKEHIKNSEVQNPATKSGGIIDLLN